MLAKRRVAATIPASDLARAKRWYEEKLGLKPVREAPYGIDYVLGDGTRFGLYPTGNAGKAPNTLMGFSSTDVVGDVAALRKLGVKFEDYDLPQLKTVGGIASMDGAKAAWFKDSEGNILAIFSQPG
jgi:catechol 2,3-dioxygenase-like lactoylglutathione lyase family enzyme